MKIFAKVSLAAVLFMTMTVFTVFASGPTEKRVSFTIGVPFVVETGADILPPGDYVLYQIDRNNLNLFTLHPEDTTNEPVAVIHTTLIAYPTGEYPKETRIMLGKDEENNHRNDVLRLTGWTIPGMDGWEVRAVVE